MLAATAAAVALRLVAYGTEADVIVTPFTVTLLICPPAPDTKVTVPVA